MTAPASRLHADGRDPCRAARDVRLAGLLAAAARGDAAAFESFYDETFACARALARRMLADADLDDVLADAYFEAWRDAARYEPARASAMTWLLLIVRSRALDLLRRHAAHPSVGGGAEPADAPTDPGDDPAERLWRQEAGGRLHEALLRLAPAERWVLGLAYFRDLTHSEIAHCTGLPLGTLKSHLLRAQTKLRAALSAPTAVPRPTRPPRAAARPGAARRRAERTP